MTRSIQSGPASTTTRWTFPLVALLAGLLTPHSLPAQYFTSLTPHSPCRTITAVMDTSGHRCRADLIIVADAVDGRVLQLITPGENLNSWWTRIDHMFFRPDMNFDGYSDIALRRSIDSNGNEHYYFWRYDNATGLFVEDTILESHLHYFELNPARGIIYSFSRPTDPPTPILDQYTYVNGRPTLTEAWTSEENPSEPGRTVLTRRRRINGRMEVVEIERRKSSP